MSMAWAEASLSADLRQQRWGGQGSGVSVPYKSLWSVESSTRALTSAESPQLRRCRPVRVTVWRKPWNVLTAPYRKRRIMPGSFVGVEGALNPEL